jgi:hypothetical protein
VARRRRDHDVRVALEDQRGLADPARPLNPCPVQHAPFQDRLVLLVLRLERGPLINNPLTSHGAAEISARKNEGFRLGRAPILPRRNQVSRQIQPPQYPSGPRSLIAGNAAPHAHGTQRRHARPHIGIKISFRYQGTCRCKVMASGIGGLGGRVKACADDAVSVDPVVAVDVFQGPWLAEPGHAERNGRYPVNGRFVRPRSPAAPRSATTPNRGPARQNP